MVKRAMNCGSVRPRGARASILSARRCDGPIVVLPAFRAIGLPRVGGGGQNRRGGATSWQDGVGLCHQRA